MEELERLLHGLQDQGSALYRKGVRAECAEVYGRVSQLAEALGRVEHEIDGRFWHGCALHGEGRLREALAAMAPGLARPECSLASSSGYRLATRYARVLADLPARRASVEQTLDDIDLELKRAGRPSHSRTLLIRARLLLSVGDWPRAFDIAREALAARASDPVGCTHSSYRWLVVQLAIWLGDDKACLGALNEWGRVSGYVDPGASYYALQSGRLRRLGRAAEALPHARMAWVEARRTHELPTRFGCTVELATVLLTLGQVDEARIPLREALGWRSSEVAEYAYVVRLLRADWHVASARRSAGLPGWDPEFHHAYEPTDADDAPRTDRALASLQRARRAYSRVQVVGARLDALLGRPLREWQIEQRLALVDEATARVRARS